MRRYKPHSQYISGSPVERDHGSLEHIVSVNFDNVTRFEDFHESWGACIGDEYGLKGNSVAPQLSVGGLDFV